MLMHLDILLGLVFIISSKGTVTPTPKLKIQSLRIIAYYQKIPLSPHNSEKAENHIFYPMRGNAVTKRMKFWPY